MLPGRVIRRVLRRRLAAGSRGKKGSQKGSKSRGFRFLDRRQKATSALQLSAPSPGDDLRSKSSTRLHSQNCLGQESCRTKVSRIFRIFVPNFAPNFAPNFPRIFRGLFVLRFVGDGDQKKFTKNPRHFSMENSQANTQKIFTKFFWRAGKVRIVRSDF